ncbi:MAG: YfcE family phosphodiesterase [Christensenellales bacterium]
MTRIFVLSDSHGATDMLARATRFIEGRAYDYIVHLGDYHRDAVLLSQKIGRAVHAVAGNCDVFSRETREMLLPIGQLKMLLTHGDRYGVKRSYAPLAARAKACGAALALFGHTHVAHTERIGGVLLVNPGALQDGCAAEVEIGADIVAHRIQL